MLVINFIEKDRIRNGQGQNFYIYGCLQLPRQLGLSKEPKLVDFHSVCPFPILHGRGHFRPYPPPISSSAFSILSSLYFLMQYVYVIFTSNFSRSVYLSYLPRALAVQGRVGKGRLTNPILIPT